MFAIIQVGGNQYRVAVGDAITVDRLEGNVGERLNFPALLVADGSDVAVGQDAQKTQVETKIVSHAKGQKVHIRRFRAKSRYRRHIGFRPSITTLKIEAIFRGKESLTKKTDEKSHLSAKAKSSQKTRTPA